MVKKKKYIKKILISISLFLLTLIVLFSTFAVSGIDKVHAEEATSYTNVLEDLEKDDTFSATDYPVVANDYSLQVIQIAESDDKELFIYVYQPSVLELQATSINFSIVVNEDVFVSNEEVNENYKNYKLIFLNSNGVFSKYKVDNFQVVDDVVRNYAISSIFRGWNSTIDAPASGDNEISEVSYSVGKVWTAQTVNNEVFYSCIDTETIEITDKFVGFYRYPNGFKFYSSSCDAHYIAFSTDKEIDKLIEAEVYFVTRDCVSVRTVAGIDTTKGDAVDNYKYLKYTDVASNPGDGWFGEKYEWERIETVSQFIEGKDLRDDVLDALSNKQFVLSFFESEFQDFVGTVMLDTSHFTEVSDVSILRLKFESEGVVYDLGVVDNKQSGSLTPSNNVNTWLDKLISTIIVVLTVFLVVLLIIFSIPFLPSILTFIWNVIIAILKGIWWLISWPFKKIKERSSE